jgi:hypothetical protein
VPYIYIIAYLVCQKLCRNHSKKIAAILMLAFLLLPGHECSSRFTLPEVYSGRAPDEFWCSWQSISFPFDFEGTGIIMIYIYICNYVYIYNYLIIILIIIRRKNNKIYDFIQFSSRRSQPACNSSDPNESEHWKSGTCKCRREDE